MRSVFALVALLAVALVPARADGIRFLRVWPQWHDADSFQSFYEYRTGQELVGKWIVLRSQPDDRAGLYFLVRVENPAAALKGSTFVVRVISPESIEVHVYNFPTDVPSGSNLFEVGLTGKDWGASRVQPVAWNVELHGPDGALLAKKVSFLWEKPDR